MPVSPRESTWAASFGDASGAAGMLVPTPPQAARKANDERKRVLEVARSIEFMCGEWSERAAFMNASHLSAPGSILSA